MHVIFLLPLRVCLFVYFVSVLSIPSKYLWVAMLATQLSNSRDICPGPIRHTLFSIRNVRPEVDGVINHRSLCSVERENIVPDTSMRYVGNTPFFPSIMCYCSLVAINFFFSKLLSLEKRIWCLIYRFVYNVRYINILVYASNYKFAKRILQRAKQILYAKSEWILLTLIVILNNKIIVPYIIFI